MREIKFRAWDSVLNEYRKLDMNSGKQNLGMGFEVMGGINSNITTIYHSVGDVIEQYTGLNDINGKEIYEGDIVNVTWQRDDVEGENYAIAYDPNNDGYPAFELVDWYEDVNGLSCAYIDGQITVIGNIFENPELLEVCDEQ